MLVHRPALLVLCGTVACSGEDMAATSREGSTAEQATAPDDGSTHAETPRESEHPAEAQGVPDREAELLRALGYLSSEPVHARTGVVRHDRESAYQGWNLYVSQHAQEAVLMDMDGRTLHTWRSAREAAAPSTGKAPLLAPWWRTVHLYPNGDLLTQTDYGWLVRLDRDSRVVWTLRERTHHDFDVRSDGHIFVLTNIRAEVPGTRDEILEVDPNGRVVRRVLIMQALIDGGQREALRELDDFGRQARGVVALDPLHTNSIELLDGSLAPRLPAFARGNVLISLPTINRVAVLDLDAAQAIWSLRGTFRYQHHATMLENGHMLLFDNKGLGGERSRVLEIDPITGREVWSYGESESQSFYSECCGRVYRLENGNTLVVDSKTARAFEITEPGEIVWEFRSPHTRSEAAASLNDLLRLPVDSARGIGGEPIEATDDH